MRNRLLAPVTGVLLLAAVALVGCGDKSDDFDPKTIAVPQSGDGPPPMNAPMGGEAQSSSGTTG